MGSWIPDRFASTIVFSPQLQTDTIVTEIGCTVTEGEYLCAGNDVTMDTSQATKGRHVTRWQHSSHVPCLLDRVNITATNAMCHGHVSRPRRTVPGGATATPSAAPGPTYPPTLSATSKLLRLSTAYISNDTAEVMSP